MVVNVIANVLSNTFFLVNKPFKGRGRVSCNEASKKKVLKNHANLIRLYFYF